MFKVKFSVFVSYLKSIGTCMSLTIISMFLMMEACTVGAGVWLAYWSSANITTNEKRNFYLGVYGGIGLGQGLFTFLQAITVVLGSMVASRRSDVLPYFHILSSK